MEELISIPVEKLDSFLKNYVPTRYMNQRQAVNYTGTSPATINSWVKEKGLQQIIMHEDANPKYDAKDLDRLMEEHKTK